MSSMIKLGLMTIFASVLLVSCGKKDKKDKQKDKDAAVAEQDMSEDAVGAETPEAEGSVAETPEVVETAPMHTSLSLNGVVDIIFFEQDIVGLSQARADGSHMIWLLSNNISSGFSGQVKKVVKKLSQYAAAENDQFLYNSICKGDAENRKRLFFQKGIVGGILGSIDGSGNVFRYGTAIESKARYNSGHIRGYHLTSAIVQGGEISSVLLMGAESASLLNRVDAPEGLAVEALRLDVDQINLETYNDSLNNIWSQGSFSACDAT